MKTKKPKVLDLKKTTITVLKNPSQILGGTSGNPFRRTWQEPTHTYPPTTTGPGRKTISNTHKTG